MSEPSLKYIHQLHRQGLGCAVLWEGLAEGAAGKPALFLQPVGVLCITAPSVWTQTESGKWVMYFLQGKLPLPEEYIKSFFPGQPDIVIIIFKRLAWKVNGEKKSLKRTRYVQPNLLPI